MRILVAFGSKRGGTQGIAEQAGEALRTVGHAVDVRPAREVGSLEPYDAVLLGGALYMYHWHRDARRFARRHEDALVQRPTWFFSSGPLDDSAERLPLPPVPGVQKLMDRVHARGHETFGGRLEADAPGFTARHMAREHAGDWRDAGHIRRWAREVAEALPAPTPAPSGWAPPPRQEPGPTPSAP